jgi:ATP-dependent exoDNAse (exonuclease V) alpha subunit
VSGSTAQRLGQDSPALAGRTLTLDALVARVEHGRLDIDSRTTIFFDEAGMADTSRLDRLAEIVERAGAKLVVIGDGAQLPSIGAGGMFDRLAKPAPSAQLSNVRRTLDRAERRAWADLRAGRSDRAMAHYLRRGQLHMTDTRDQAVERAVGDWARLTKESPIEQVAHRTWRSTGSTLARSTTAPSAANLATSKPRSPACTTASALATG